MELYVAIYNIAWRDNPARRQLYYTVSKKQSVDNFWHKDGQDDIIMYGALIYHLT